MNCNDEYFIFKGIFYMFVIVYVVKLNLWIFFKNNDVGVWEGG